MSRETPALTRGREDDPEERLEGSIKEEGENPGKFKDAMNKSVSTAARKQVR